MGCFADKTVIVTGGAQGLGRAQVEAFCAEGARVVIADVSIQGAALARQIGDRARFFELDVSDQAMWRVLVADVDRTWGPISVLVNNAGIFSWTAFEQADTAHWRRMLDVNVIGTFLGIQAVTPSMRSAGGGAIVNISSVAGLRGMAGAAAYSASKWAVRGITKSLALELAKYGIRVNSVHPGIVETPASIEAGLGQQAVQNHPIPRLGHPSDLAKMVLFVASEDCAFSTGSEFVADGGMVTGVVSHK